MATMRPKPKAKGRQSWEVRWYPEAGAMQKSKSFPSKIAAEAWLKQVENALAHNQEPPDPHRRKKTLQLGAWYEDIRARARWSKNAQLNYWHIYRAHLAHEKYGIAELTLGQLTADRIKQFDRDMESAGVGIPTRQKSLTLASSLLSKAADDPKRTGINKNPMLGGGVRKPSTQQKSEALAFSPDTVEAVRSAALDAFGLSVKDRERDALWISCGSLAGLRPEEIWALTPKDFRENTLSITKAIAQGELKPVKNYQNHYPPLHPVLWEEADSYIQKYEIGPDDFIFPDPTDRDLPIQDHNWRNWRKRNFRPARDRALSRVPAKVKKELAVARPYDLGRHSYASLRLRAGMSHDLAGLVAELGHTSVQQLNDTYAHVVGDLRASKTGPIDWVEEVRKARKKHAQWKHADERVRAKLLAA